MTVSYNQYNKNNIFSLKYFFYCINRIFPNKLFYATENYFFFFINNLLQFKIETLYLIQCFLVNLQKIALGVNDNLFFSSNSMKANSFPLTTI